MPEAVHDALQLGMEVIRHHQMVALDDFLKSCQSFASEGTLNIAVLGRFKAGKSSFLNHLFRREVLPVGAVPVTAVVTDIAYGPDERAEVLYESGAVEQVPIERISEFVSETENAENSKHVVRVRVELPSLQPYQGLRFVDTPGLQSALEHNTQASLEWLPNVGLALVAVGVDSPLSQHDLDLLRNLSRYTPKICVLLTKFDILDQQERCQVQEFVQKQLGRYLEAPVAVLPYSVRPGFEHFRVEIEGKLLSRVCVEASQQHSDILAHKVDSLLAECSEFLTVARRAAETEVAERDRLLKRIAGEKEYLDDTRQSLRLIARHAAATSRAAFERILRTEEAGLRGFLLAELHREYPFGAHNLNTVVLRFEPWLESSAVREMKALSSRHRAEFIEPVRRVSRQLSQSLQDFRNRLSERALRALGVPLRTTEMCLLVEDPRSPDVKIGKIFDRNWELLAFVLPMPLIGGLLKKHLRRKVADVVFVNLSRLASQWEEVVRTSVSGLENEAIQRLNALIATVERLIVSTEEQPARIQADLFRIKQMRMELGRR